MTETVWREVREQLADRGKIEVLIGIPTFNNAKTVEPVVKAVTAGISKVCPGASVLVINADAGSQDGTPEIIKQAGCGARLSDGICPALGRGLPFRTPLTAGALRVRGARPRACISGVLYGCGRAGGKCLPRHRCQSSIPDLRLDGGPASAGD